MRPIHNPGLITKSNTSIRSLMNPNHNPNTDLNSSINVNFQSDMPNDKSVGNNTSVFNELVISPIPACGHPNCIHTAIDFVNLIVSPFHMIQMVPPASKGCISIPSFYGQVSDYAAALPLFKAARTGKMRLVQTRLTELQRQYIKEGQGYIYDEIDSGIQRWTDGFDWKDSYWQYNKKSMLYKQADRVVKNNVIIKVEKLNGLRKRVIVDGESTLRLICYFKQTETNDNKIKHIHTEAPLRF